MSIFFISFSCQKKKNQIFEEKKYFSISQEETEWLTGFFNDILLFKGGIYTLWGSKPITLIQIEHFTEEEIRKHYESLSEQKKQNGIYCTKKYTLPQDWEKWKKISDRFPMKRYLLFQSNWGDTPRATFVCFMDILKTIFVIQKNYAAFRDVVGFDFDPALVVFEIQEDKSEFWQKAKNNALLLGLLFGYGKKNSYIYYWKNFMYEDNPFFSSLRSKSSWDPTPGKWEINLKNLQIPSFLSYEEDDKTILKYQREKETIRKIYQVKDFLKLTLERLIRD